MFDLFQETMGKLRDKNKINEDSKDSNDNNEKNNNSKDYKNDKEGKSDCYEKYLLHCWKFKYYSCVEQAMKDNNHNFLLRNGHITQIKPQKKKNKGKKEKECSGKGVNCIIFSSPILMEMINKLISIERNIKKELVRKNINHNVNGMLFGLLKPGFLSGVKPNTMAVSLTLFGKELVLIVAKNAIQTRQVLSIDGTWMDRKPEFIETLVDSGYIERLKSLFWHEKPLFDGQIGAAEFIADEQQFDDVVVHKYK